MFTKYRLEMFVAVYWSYDQWCISIVSTVTLVEHSLVKFWILALLYKSTPGF